MKITLSLDDMSLEEKLRAMEMIWEDLCRKTPDFPSPDWHRDVLAEREKRAEAGGEFVDWTEAKARIGKSTS